jgi:hypothetical protein
MDYVKLTIETLLSKYCNIHVSKKQHVDII